MRRPATFGGVIGLAGVTSGYYFGDAPVPALAVLAAMSVALLAIGAWAAGVSFPTTGGRVRRATVPAMALLLVTTATAGPVVADHNTGHSLGFQDCDAEDSLIGAFLSGFGSPNDDGKCRFNPDDQSTAGADLKAIAKTQNEAVQDFIDAEFRYLPHERASLWSETKFATIESLNNNKTLAEAKNHVNQTIGDYAANKYEITLNKWNDTVAVAEYINEADPKNLSAGYNVTGFATVRITGTIDDDSVNMYPADNFSKTFRTPVLYNTADNEPKLAGPRWLDHNYINTTILSISGENKSDLPTTNDGDYYYTGNEITYDYNGSQDLWSPGRMYNLYTDKDVQSLNYNDYFNNFRDNAMPFVEETYNQYQAGDLDKSELLSAYDLAGRANTNYNTTGYYGFAATQMASLGWETDLNTSFSVTSNGTTYDGYLFYTGNDSITFQNGTTYDPTSYTGAFFMSYQTKNGSDTTELTENFTVSRLTNPKNGESLNKTTTEQYVYDTGNASRLQEELNQTSKLREELEEQESTTGGGGGGPLGANATTGLAIVAAVGAIYAIGRSRD